MLKKFLILLLVLTFLISITVVSLAADFDWKRFEGETINLLLNKHPYTDGMLKELDKFEEKTGINVKYDIYPEEEYFNKVTVALSSGSSDYDVFMTGAYQVWQYAPPGWMEPLGQFMNNDKLTNPNWDEEDFLPNLLQALRWNLEPGSKLGNGKQWALPWGYETNTLMYRKDIFEKYDLKVPETLDEVIEVGKIIEEKTDMIPIAVRGTRSWATIHPGFLSGFVGSGGKDYDKNMNPAMNNDLGVKYAKKWVEMVKEVGPKQWTTYTWYDVGNAIGSGKAAMIYDADILGFFQNAEGSSKASGKIAWAPGPGLEEASYKPNMWIWSLAMSAHSKNKKPAWYFLQWATGKELLTKGATEYKMVDPVRQSVWNNKNFKARLENFTGYYDTFKKVKEGCFVHFTPQPMFFETTTEWAAALHKIYNDEMSAKKALDQLAKELKKRLEAIK